MSGTPIKITLYADSSHFTDGLYRAHRRLNAFQAIAKGAGKDIARLGMIAGAVGGVGIAAVAAGAAAAAAGFTSMTQTAMQTRGELEYTALSFQSIYKTSKEANTALAGVQSLVGSFSFETVAQFSKQLAGAGVAATDLKGITQGLLGTTSAFGLNTDRTNRALLAFGQMLSKGKIQAEEVRQQLAETGIPVMSMLAKILGVNKQKVEELMAAGKLGTPVVLELFQKLRETYGGALWERLNTLPGRFEAFKNAAKFDITRAYDPILDVVFRRLPQASKDFGASLKALRPEFQFLAVLTEKLFDAFHKLPGAIDAMNKKMGFMADKSKSAKESLTTISKISFANMLQAAPKNSVIGTLLDQKVLNIKPQKEVTTGKGKKKKTKIEPPEITFDSNRAAILGEQLFTDMFTSIMDKVSAMDPKPFLTDMVAKAVEWGLALVSVLFDGIIKGIANYTQKNGTGDLLVTLLAFIPGVGGALSKMIGPLGKVISGLPFGGLLGGLLKALASAFKGADAIGAAILKPIGEGLAKVFPALGKVFSTLGKSVGDVFKPIGVWISQKLTALGTFLGGILQGVGVFIGNLFKPLTTAVSTAINVVVTTFGATGNIFKTVGVAIMEGIQLLGSGLKGAFMGVVNILKGAFNGILSFFTGIPGFFKGAWNGLVKIFTDGFQIWKNIISMGIANAKGILKGIMTMLQPVAGWVRTAFNAVKTAFSTAFNFIKTVITTGINNIKTNFSKITGAITSVVGNAVSAAQKLGKSIIDAVVKFVGPIASKVGDKVKGIAKAVSGFVGDAVSAAQKLGKGIIDGVVKAVGPLATKAKDAVSKGVTAVKDTVSSWVQAGKDLLAGLAKGIADGATGAIEAAASMAKNAVDTVKKMLGIHSPSRVFKELGEFLIDGFVIGITGSYDSVKSAMTGLSSLVLGLRDQYKEALGEARQEKKDALADVKEARKELDNALKHKITASKKNKKAYANAVRAHNEAIREARRSLKEALKDYGVANKELDDILKLSKTVGNSKFMNKLEDRMVTWSKKLTKIATEREAVAAKLEDAKQKLEAAIALRDDFAKSTADAAKATGNLTELLSKDAEGNDKPASLADFQKNLKHKISAIRSFTKQVALLNAKGLNDAMLKQVLEMGPETGAEYARALLSGGATGINELNTLQSDLESASDKLGKLGGNALYQSGVDSANELVNGLQDQYDALTSASEALAKAMIEAFRKSFKLGKVMDDEVQDWFAKYEDDKAKKERKGGGGGTNTNTKAATGGGSAKPVIVEAGVVAPHSEARQILKKLQALSRDEGALALEIRGI